jgi:DNA-binding transcriptional LysR family regulator
MPKIVRANQLGIELRHLVALDAVARNRSFHAAADELGYTQSAISQQIASLEQIVGRPLFERSRGPRPISLTEAGRVLLGHAEAVLARVEAASADVTALVEGAVGELRVGTYQSVATRLLPVVLTRFKERWPRIDVQLFESGSHDEIDGRVERGALDIAFTTPPIPNDELFAYTELLRDPYLLVVHPDHPLARAGRPPRLAALAEHDLIGYRVCRAHARMERHLREHGVEPRVVMRAEDNNLLQGLAAQGAGAAVMPLLAIDLGRPDTVVLDLRGQVPPREIGLLWHRGRHLGRPAQDFVALAREAAGELAEQAVLAPAA